MRDFETPASLYDYPCVVVLKSIYCNRYHIRCRETSRILVPFSMGRAFVVRLWKSLIQTRNVFNHILCNYVYILVGDLITTTNHITTCNSYKYPRVLWFHCKYPCLRGNAQPSLSRFKRSIRSEQSLPTIHCCVFILVSAHGVWSRCRFYGLHNSDKPGRVDAHVRRHFDEGSCSHPRAFNHCGLVKARIWYQIRWQAFTQTDVNVIISWWTMT